MAVGRPQGPPYVRGYITMLPQEKRRTISEVAEDLGVNREWLGQRLRGEKWISFADAQRICSYFGEPYATLFPNNSGIDPDDLETVRVALEVGAA
jgi:transcriptional regulator with XRE-family HTH domain